MSGKGSVTKKVTHFIIQKAMKYLELSYENFFRCQMKMLYLHVKRSL